MRSQQLRRDSMKVTVKVELEGNPLFVVVDYVNKIEDVHSLYKYIEDWMLENVKKRALERSWEQIKELFFKDSK